ncbi:hypothetical protein AGABI2DRAFT_153008 [Agaricus bisporus var. bisporus H97]|uniref:hypothetical protein n=1 Tax=Agaricus bisporus var. bisporus (strain H97 / ATCC MYA-4626 / FGSC 10389) TaxID=936046 RepID=UPI00029F6D52|nr:hypothetical protein AGABI2DRAFT_153008 [Agaricus bisporus var. bisporus H97]EKV44689.1 hypothetical protein AGABI2DRAFT_153008 [Agaricus bisporus var. bisporus H97]
MASFDSLAGKRFVLYPDETEEITYQVASYCTIRKQYEIVFDDLLDDFIRISVDELRNMLDGSKICTSP